MSVSSQSTQTNEASICSYIPVDPTEITIDDPTDSPFSLNIAPPAALPNRASIEKNLQQHFPQTLTNIYQPPHLWQHSITLHSDGSVKVTHGSSGWILAKNTTFLLVGAGYLPPCTHLTSYRAELAGILAGSSTIHTVHSSAHTIRTITVSTDSQSAISKLTRIQSTQLHPLDRDSDLLFPLLQLMAELLKIDFVHTRGHSDNRMPPLTFNEYVNVHCDSLADLPPTELQPQPPLIPVLVVNNEIVNAAISTTIHDSLFHRELLTWMQQKQRLTPEQSNDIDWSAHAATYSRS